MCIFLVFLVFYILFLLVFGFFSSLISLMLEINKKSNRSSCYGIRIHYIYQYIVLFYICIEQTSTALMVHRRSHTHQIYGIKILKEKSFNFVGFIFQNIYSVNSSLPFYKINYQNMVYFLCLGFLIKIYYNF